jgi:serine protease Do
MKRLILFLVFVFPLSASERRTEITKVYEDTVKSVVEVKIGTRSRGTGVAVKKNVIATASHVVMDRDTVQIVIHDGKIVDGEVFFNDSDYDLALVRVKIELKPIKLCLDPLIGEVAIAIGNPFKHKNSVTTGIVSGLDRDMELSYVTLHGLIQTSACINPGNSGGPLLNINGELLGINVVTQQNGLGFAVRSKDLAKALTVE